MTTTYAKAQGWLQQNKEATQGLLTDPKISDESKNIYTRNLEVYEEMYRALRMAAAVESGEWKMVPVEPTEEILHAYQQAFISRERFYGAMIYKAMINNAPEFGDE